MKETYPFRGVWRWAVMPALLMAAEAVDSIFGWTIDGGLRNAQSVLAWLLTGWVQAVIIGASLAIGKRPAVAWIAALVLGWLGYWAEQSMLVPLGHSLGAMTTLERLMARIPAFAMILAHQAYLGLRRRGTLVFALYPVVGILGLLVYVQLALPTVWRELPWLRWGVQLGLLNGAAMVAAVRLAERKGVGATSAA